MQLWIVEILKVEYNNYIYRITILRISVEDFTKFKVREISQNIPEMWAFSDL